MNREREPTLYPKDAPKLAADERQAAHRVACRFLHPNCKRLIALLQVLLKFAPGEAMAWLKERAQILCA